MLDPNGEFSIGSFWAGFAHAVSYNYSLGLINKRDSQSDGDYQVGQTLGDVASMVAGAYETAAGIAGVVAGTGGGAALAPATGGASVAVGLAVDATSAGMIGHGAAISMFAGKNVGRDIQRNLNNPKSDSVKTSFSQHALNRMSERGISSSKVEAIMKNSNQFDYYHQGTWKTGYYDPNSKIFVGQLKNTGKITTVINNVDPQYISNLQSFKP